MLILGTKIHNALGAHPYLHLKKSRDVFFAPVAIACLLAISQNSLVIPA